MFIGFGICNNPESKTPGHAGGFVQLVLFYFFLAERARPFLGAAFFLATFLTAFLAAFLGAFLAAFLAALGAFAAFLAAGFLADLAAALAAFFC